MTWRWDAGRSIKLEVRAGVLLRSAYDQRTSENFMDLKKEAVCQVHSARPATSSIRTNKFREATAIL